MFQRPRQRLACLLPRWHASWRHVVSASVQDPQQIVLIKESEQQQRPMQFPAIWLRDNCTCEQCFHKDSLSRKPTGWNRFDTTIKVKNILPDASEAAVRIEWTDQHSSVFDLDWLRERDFSPENHRRYISEWYRPEIKCWAKADFQQILKRFAYSDIMEQDAVLLQWLEALAIYGVAMLQQAPLAEDVVKTLAERIGFLRKTTYGEDFNVKSQPGAKNYAYLAAPLPLHTDLPYYEYNPSVTILHTLEQSQSSGGWNTIIDGFHIADQLRKQQPHHFRILSETPVDWSDIGTDKGVAFHNIWRAPVICLDGDGHFKRINHSVPQRDNHFNIDVDKVVPWYEALAHFLAMAQEQTVSFKTQPGDVLSFNNLRMLHGRTGYDDTEHNVRHIVGGFLDWDIVYSKMRVLKKQLSKHD